MGAKTGFRPGAARPYSAELDPCIAAQGRLKTSLLNTRVKCGICIVIVLAMAIIILAFVLHVVLSELSARPDPVLTMTTAASPMRLRKPSSTAASKKKLPAGSNTTKLSSGVPGEVRATAPLPDTYPSCAHVMQAKLPSGVYQLRPQKRSFTALCDSQTDGGGWTVVQKRISGKIEFYNRSWAEYRDGFGDTNDSYWLGLQNVYELQSAFATLFTLRIELYGDFCSDRSKCSGMPDGHWWSEWNFKLGDESSGYALHVSEHKRGNLNNKTDHFKGTHDGRPFTTIDRDNDSADYNCAQMRNFGGWWHLDCGYSALNGLYGDTSSKRRYQYWYHDDGLGYYIHPKTSIMMVR